MHAPFIDLGFTLEDFQAGIGRLLRGIRAPDLNTEQFIEEFHRGHADGRGISEIAVVWRHFKNIEWSWPELDNYRELFKNADPKFGMWVGRFRGFNDLDTGERMKPKMVPLRFHHLAGIARGYGRGRNRARCNMRLLTGGMRSIYVGIRFSPWDEARLAPEILKFMIERFQALDIHDLDTWPPFFPGDDSSVFVVSRYDDQRYAKENKYPLHFRRIVG